MVLSWLYKKWRGTAQFFPASLFLASVLLCSGGVVPMAQAQQASPLSEEGLWLVEGKDGIFRIGPCQPGGGNLCGWLVGMDYTTPEPDKDVWGRSECGLQIISDMKRGENGRWNGHVLDPGSGRSYSARLWLDKHGRLKLLGYLGLPLFGQVQRWTRYQGPPIGEKCHMASDRK
ncbi:DUF2147 domain-containing protein [Saccharibacter sp. 17.LH.SD]|uniref:DUF2147 domain-containing protein n=1 Tax=Saccharibacter sp. 17.LH.SD TaxID=2689393 RepID=UPI00136E3D25|nr:DUF2147 domain-containing protein [Saccharibacter sp. 17.LH.SD]MXV44579.1 DUF2147 domain-containing protein [Saccharibacter sp. 17.LH.SD]